MTTSMRTVPWAAVQWVPGVKKNVPVICAAPRGSTREAVSTYSPATEHVVTSA
jgi:hypothetical protein